MNRFKRILAMTIVVGTLVNIVQPVVVSGKVSTQEEQSYVVALKKESALKKLENCYDGERIAEDTAIAEVSLNEAEVAELQKDNNILYCEKNITLSGDSVRKNCKENDIMKEDLTTADEVYQWNKEAIGVTDVKLSGRKVKVELLDSGVSEGGDIEVEKNVNLVNPNANINPMFLDDNGHGTAMAGMICAKENEQGITGINPDIELYSVKALDSRNQAPLSRIVEGIYWGIENDVDIINMSFGTEVDSDILHQAVREAEEAGILMIASAGNSKHQAVHYPAAYQEVLAVGSASPDGKASDDTSLGKEMDLFAPGEQIVTTGLFYGLCGTSGTSIAAAQVSGVASLLLSQEKRSPRFVRQVLKESARKMNDEKALGKGLVDYQYAHSIYDKIDELEEFEQNEYIIQNSKEVRDYSEQLETNVEGMWMESEHNSILNYANNANSEQYNMDDLNTISRISYRADVSFAAASGEYPTTCLHGNWNYVASLKFLWNLAREIAKKSKPTKRQIKEIVTKCGQKISMESFSAEEKDRYTKLVNNTCQLLYEEGIGKAGRHNRNVVLGFAFHLLGDLYAHQVMVPVYTVKKWDVQGSFKESSSMDSQDARLGRVHFDTKYWNTVRDGVLKGQMTFTALNQYAAPKLNKPGEKISLAPKYEDNIKFCRRRYSQAQIASARFLKHYASNIDAHLISIITPKEEWGFKLSKYKKWAAHCGFGDTYTDEKWAVFSANY